MYSCNNFFFFFFFSFVWSSSIFNSCLRTDSWVAMPEPLCGFPRRGLPKNLDSASHASLFRCSLWDQQGWANLSPEQCPSKISRLSLGFWYLPGSNSFLQSILSVSLKKSCVGSVCLLLGENTALPCLCGFRTGPAPGSLLPGLPHLQRVYPSCFYLSEMYWISKSRCSPNSLSFVLIWPPSFNVISLGH